MHRSILGFLILGAIVAGSGSYAYVYYNNPELKNTAHDELTIPQKGQLLRQKTDKPMEEFEKKMGQRLNDRKTTGVDISDNKLNRKKKEHDH